MSIIEFEKPVGVIVQFGGQTPLKLAERLHKSGVPIIGTSVDSIDLAEDRERFGQLIQKLKLQQAPYITAKSIEDARQGAKEIGYPVMIRPSFVLGGRAMRVVHNDTELNDYFAQGFQVSNDRPVLVDRYLSNAIEVDLDLVSDGDDVVIAGVMEHIERAGIHSGDSSCCIPPISLAESVVESIKDQAKLIARELKVVGLMNVQFAITQNNEIYILEVNPRASRTVPFVSKANGVPWAKVAARLMAGKKLSELNLKISNSKNYAIKACVFPFSRFRGVDIILGPEMKSTGEVMGMYKDFPGGFAKAQYAVGNLLPKGGTVFLSVMDHDKSELDLLANNLVKLGFDLVATKGTAKYLVNLGFKVSVVNKVLEGSPHIVDMLQAGKIDLVINTPEGAQTFLDSKSIRLTASELGIPTYTTMAAAHAACQAIGMIQLGKLVDVKALQDYHSTL
jgi:carbamoyl-phosphate synthase large subunit